MTASIVCLACLSVLHIRQETGNPKLSEIYHHSTLSTRYTTSDEPALCMRRDFHPYCFLKYIAGYFYTLLCISHRALSARFCSVLFIRILRQRTCWKVSCMPVSLFTFLQFFSNRAVWSSSYTTGLVTKSILVCSCSRLLFSKVKQWKAVTWRNGVEITPE